MAEHEPSIGATDEWLTPPEIFDSLGLRFDLDPCSSGNDWVPARRTFTKRDDGLRKEWHGLVFMNPPFGGRNGHVPWLVRFFDHGRGVGIVRAYTSAGWWHDHMHRADALFFPRGKTKFIRPNGTVGRSPGHGVVLIGTGKLAVGALARMEGAGLGMLWRQRR